ncbi:hypothetical protein BHM03_00062031, partial [Ensete ventricosum]
SGCPLRLAAALPRGNHPGDRAVHEQQPLTGWPPLAGYYPYGRSPLAGSQAMAGRPCRGPGRGQPPLHADSMHVAAPPLQAAPISLPIAATNA